MANYKIFTYSLLIKEHHLDSLGHVNNATYLNLLEEARWEFLHARGISLNSIHSTEIGPVILECTIQFLKELTLRQDITIKSQLISQDKKIAVMQQNIFNSQHEICSRATLTFGVFDLKTRKLILPPQYWLEAMGID